MKISIIGCGYVGLVTGACLADSGNDVVCVDIDQAKVDELLAGGVPIYEPGLAELIARNRENGSIDFTTDRRRAVEHADVVFIAVATPMSEGGEADLSYVHAAAGDIGAYLDRYKVIVDKSTVPVGTAERVREIISAKTSQEFDVVSNPEFLKEGTAVTDFMKPDRVILGSDSKRAVDIMRELYEPYLRTFHPLIVMDIKSAEMAKYAANCFLATKISFINEISNLCEKAGADISAVREAIGADRRIGYEFLFPGVGYGGSCLPKDVQALIHTAAGLGTDMRLLRAVDEVNTEQKATLVAKIVAHFGDGRPAGDLTGLRVGVWGLSFKPQTDDMREAASLVIVRRLLELGATVRAFDPEAGARAKEALGDSIEYAGNMYEAVEGADALVLVTEWKQFQRPSWQRVRSAMRGHVVFDGRNIYDPRRLRAEGFEYYGMGRH
ncbi:MULTISPECIES: UDP-glucose/GDP-mannose dehydrogenase family protein [unclassified Mycobacterium]|uniref:UDP-glucose dehydrogenase family protein n=1 Tax=unclassified Mycobacterium TaxID=2642494 RepID=UPI000801FA71|nr:MULTISPECIES: UDP-glucose/GDP-mannose dehydrogenase family protein [unclassified Mycobacterium]OBH14122.1 UDP-glucose 6-dehydrogenase [Mycobacterium sp. E3247]OBI18825.1 UDP-glucose 6-dehydrogenase [Mycobacterium sp. E2497]